MIRGRAACNHRCDSRGSLVRRARRIIAAMTTIQRVPVTAIVRITANAKGHVTARVNVCATADFDPSRLKNYGFMMWSALSAHGFSERDVNIRPGVWHPDRREYLWDTVFTWSESAEKGGAWVLLVEVKTTFKLNERLPNLLRALVMPMSHPNVVFTPKGRSNIPALRNVKLPKTA